MYAIKRDVQTKSVTCLIGADLKGNVITNTSSPFLSSYVLGMVGPTEKLEENIIAASTWGSKSLTRHNQSQRQHDSEKKG